MPQALNRIPAGLLSLLQIKSTGRNPDLLADDMRPTLDMLNFYSAGIGARIEESFELAFDPSNLNTSIAIVTVPSDEIWIVRNVTSTARVTTAGGGERANFATLLQNIQATENVVLAAMPVGNNLSTWADTLATTDGCHANFSVGLFVPPGGQIVTTCRGFSGGVARYTVGTRVLYYPLAV